MTAEEMRDLARDLLDIQLGSAADAKDLLDSSIPAADRRRLEREIDRQAREFVSDEDDYRDGTAMYGNHAII